MHISFEGKLAIWLGFFGLLGAGALEVVPERLYIGYALLGIAGWLLLFLIWHHASGWLRLTWAKGSRRKMTALAGMIFCGSGFLGFATIYFWPPSAQTRLAIASGGDRWRWDALKPSEIDLLAEKLRGKGQYSFHIACNKPECSDLAASFHRLFDRLGWPNITGEGGILAAGVTGILLNPGSDEGAKSLKLAVESSTPLRVDLGSPRQPGTSHPIMLVLGTKPEVMPSGPISAPPETHQPDVTIDFVNTKSPAIRFQNISKVTAKQIKWVVLLWNLDNPQNYSNLTVDPGVQIHEPLRIPISVFDFIRPGSYGGPTALFGSDLVSGEVKDGDRLVGTALVTCPDCKTSRSYIISIVYGKGGWYCQLPDHGSDDLIVPAFSTVPGVIKYTQELIALAQVRERIPITDNWATSRPVAFPPAPAQPTPPEKR